MSDQEYKTVIKIPWDSEAQEYTNILSRKVQDEQQAYAKVPLIFRAIRIRCNSLTRIPAYFYDESEKPLDSYPFEDSITFKELLWMLEAGLCLKGAAYILKLRSEFNFNKQTYFASKGIELLNPFTVQVHHRDGQLLFEQFIDGKHYPEKKQYWTEDEVVYLRDYNPLDDLGPGTSNASVALADGQTMRYVSAFLSNFFGSGAIPVTTLVLPKGTHPDEQKKVETFFKKAVEGIRRILATSVPIEPKILTPELKSFDLEHLDDHAVNAISDAMEVPQSILRSNSANRATAEVEYLNFLVHTIIPRCSFYEDNLNPFFKEHGFRLEFAPNELSEMQEDEEKRAASAQAYVAAGFTLEEVVDLLGIDMSRDVADKFKARMKAKELQPKPIPTDSGSEEMIPQNGQMKQELDRWLRKAISKMKAEKSAVVEFESEKIPIGVKTIISEKLKEAKTEKDVRLVFAQVEMKVQQV